MQDSIHPDKANIGPKEEDIDAIKLSQNILMAMREEGLDQQASIDAIANYPINSLKRDLNSEANRLVFWINLYNAFNLYWMRKVPANTIKSKKNHFFGKRIKVAGHVLSLNDIEHGILRKSKAWWGRGYVSKWFPSQFEKLFRVENLDPRVHFALNCGANGCPPIRYYAPENLNESLELASLGFMQTEVHDLETNVEVSQIFWMYKGDFGGRKGIRAIVLKYRPELSMKMDKFKFFPYDHTENLENFVGF